MYTIKSTNLMNPKPCCFIDSLLPIPNVLTIVCDPNWTHCPLKESRFYPKCWWIMYKMGIFIVLSIEKCGVWFMILDAKSVKINTVIDGDIMVFYSLEYTYKKEICHTEHLWCHHNCCEVLESQPHLSVF